MVFIDAINVKIRDGQVANRPIYVALGGHRATASATSSGCGPATAARAPSTGCRCSPRSRTAASTTCACVVCDGLKGLPDAIDDRLAADDRPDLRGPPAAQHRSATPRRQDWDAIAKDLKPVYTAPTEAAALERFAEFAEAWGERYPAIIRLWENAWAEFVPFLAFDVEIRTVICTTNAIESVNARIRRAVRARGHFPNEQAALKCLYLAIMSLDPTGTGPQALDQPLEGRPERLRHHLRRPPVRRTQVDQQNQLHR